MYRKLKQDVTSSWLYKYILKPLTFLLKYTEHCYIKKWVSPFSFLALSNFLNIGHDWAETQAKYDL